MLEWAMIRAPFLRLSAAALVAFGPLAPVYAQTKGRRGGSSSPVVSLPTLGASAVDPLQTPVAPVVPGQASLPAVPPSAVTMAPAAQPQAAAQAGVPEAQAAVQPAVFQPGLEPAAAAAQAKAPLLVRAQRLALSLFGLGHKDAGLVPVAAAYSPSKRSLGSRLTRPLKALALSAALTMGVIGAASPVIAQPAELDRVRIEQQARQSEVLRVSTMQELIQRWDPSKHVIVIGSLPAPAAGAVDEIAADLAGSHMYVLLVADASGLQYTDDGRNERRGNQAAEFGLGQGIGGHPAFRALVDQRTGSSDGIVYLISWGPDRYMAFGGSKAQEDAGVTPDAFKNGQLSRVGAVARDPKQGIRGAVQTVKSWSDDAVRAHYENRESRAKETLSAARLQIQSMESEAAVFARRFPKAPLALPGAAGLRERVERAQGSYQAKSFDQAAAEAAAVVSSAKAARQSMEGFEKSYASAKDELRAAAAELDALEKAAARFKDKKPKADGDLSKPDIAGMRAVVAQAERLLASEPSKASDMLRPILPRYRTALALLGAYDNDGNALAKLQEDIDANAKQKHASAGAVARQAAQSKLDRADAAYERGDSSYRDLMHEARAKVAEAQADVAAAEANAARHRFLFWLFTFLGLGALGAALTWLALRARPKIREARAQLAEKKALLKDRLEAVYGKTPDEELGNFDAKVEALIGAVGGKDLDGVTAKMAEEIRLDAATMSLVYPAMEEVVQRAEALIMPSGFLKKLVYFFRKRPFEQGLKLLKDEPVVFKPESGIPQVFGKKRDWRDDLYGSVSSQAGFTSTFEELIAKYNAAAKRASGHLTTIELKILALEPTIQGVEKAASEAGRLQAELAQAAAADGFLALEAVRTTLLPESKVALESLKAKHLKDPVGAIDGAGAEASRMADDAKSLAHWAQATRAGELKASLAGLETLKAAGFETAWIGKAFADLSKRADAAAAKGTERSIASELKSLSERGQALGSQVASAVSLAQRLAELRRSIENHEAGVSAARERIAQATGAPAEKTLREAGKDPSKTLASASRFGDNAEEALSAGKTAEAEQALAEGERLAAAASGVVAEGLAAVENQAAAVAERVFEHARLTELQPKREKLLRKIRAEYAASVLSLRAGDPAHPSADGTIDNNVDESTEHLQQSEAKRKKAEKAFSDGNVLDAADLLRQSAGHLAISQHRLDEISEKLERLERTAAANAEALAGLTKEIGARKASVSDDARSQEPTREALRVLRGSLAAAKEAVEEAKGDPFAAEARLKDAAAELAQVDVRFKNDVDMFNEASRSLRAADQAILAAANEASTVRNDGLGDSAQIISAYNALESLRGAYARAKTDLGQAHGAWAKVDAEADRIAAEAGKIAGVLRKEGQAAQEASAAITNASSKVREATGWTGRYGVYIPGSPGSDDLDRARSALADGRYDDAQRYARQARSEASNAIARAEAEVDRRYREEQERLERERRERERQEEERRAAARREEERRSSGSGTGGGSWGGGGSSSGMGGGSW